MVKNLPANAGDRHKRRGFYPWIEKIPLEEGTTTHSSILAWRIPWTEELGRLQFTGLQKSDTTEATEHAEHVLLWRRTGEILFAHPWFPSLDPGRSMF